MTWRRQALWLLIPLALVSAGAYLAASLRTAGLGFPLDDSWIYQTYARNLAERGEFAFVTGQPSAGSTGPLWSAALAVGRWLGIDPRAWTYGLGTALLAVTAGAAAWWMRIRQPERPAWWLAAGVLVAVEWHLVWASVSGMETLSLACLALCLLAGLERPSLSPFAAGVLAGLGIWLRPDAALLLFPALAATALRGGDGRPGRLLLLLCGAALSVGPYLAFNRALSGEWWPTTFYAKQAEYAALRSAPLVGRLAAQLGLPLVGAGAVLLPGVVSGAAGAIRRRAWADLLPLAWIVGHLAVYAFRLPVTYQHGRYAIPTVPVLLVMGLDGMAGWVRLSVPSLPRRLASRVWAGALVLAALAFWGIGARAYAADVAIIETEMVRTARWIESNTEAGALVAAHDIGALGYFGGRRLIDLAGLVSPEVIPILRDEAALRLYLDRAGAGYLVTFPGWYPRLTRSAAPLFVSGGRYAPAAGGENLAVYRWPTAAPPEP